MDLALFTTVFTTIFIAELGDKTQLATLLYASDAEARKMVSFGFSASALVLASAISAPAATPIARAVSPDVLRWVAGLGFIAVGGWVLLGAE